MMEFTVELHPWAEVRTQASAVRHEVFVLEQHVPVELELDAEDPHCLHAIALDCEGRCVGTGRLLRDGHIGRMAVRREWRGHGVGTALLRALIDQARRRGDRAVVLSAQCHAQGFYEAMGFIVEGGMYLDAGIEHVTMRLSF